MAAARKAPARKASTKVAVAEPAPAPSRREPLQEPVWLVRLVLVLFLVGFAAFLAREVERFRAVLP